MISATAGLPVPVRGRSGQISISLGTNWRGSCADTNRRSSRGADSSTRDAVSVEIEDNGVGIAELDRELIFERFYRVGGNEVPGTGLGLPIVRSIAAQHRASVQVRPNPSERGSVFTVIFPRLHVVPQREAA